MALEAAAAMVGHAQTDQIQVLKKKVGNVHHCFKEIFWFHPITSLANIIPSLLLISALAFQLELETEESNYWILYFQKMKETAIIVASSSFQ